MMAWANALNENGETDKARYVAQRLKEFHNEQAAEFFAPCKAASNAASEAVSSPRSVVKSNATLHPSAPAATVPFQCLAPTKALTFEDFR